MMVEQGIKDITRRYGDESRSYTLEEQEYTLSKRMNMCDSRLYVTFMCYAR